MRTVPKPWGREVIFAENELYAGKILHLNAGHCLSLQYHERKDETIFVLEGQMRLQVEIDGAMQEILLGPGQSHRIRPGARHRMRADMPCTIVEVSTPQLDDVVRLEDDYGRAGTKAP
ncbi:MAG: cupin domain-containing protein [Acidobacteriota bacterium]